MEAFIENGIYISALCGGRGKCGKCGIRILEGEINETDSDRQVFSQEELENGCRLSCTASPKTDVKLILLSEDESGFEILSEYRNESSPEHKENANGYGIAVDVGTTTLAGMLISLSDGKCIASTTAINRQRAYGADVISRILASNQGKGGELQNSIRSDLQQLVRTLLIKSSIDSNSVKKVCISGNTTMGHLLMGYSCETLGVVPFTPVNINTVTESFEEIIGGGILDCPATILPGISTFVGGDIVSGLLACGFDRSSKISLLVDLGTNGEMALGNRDRIMVTSAAAGPAFEGGNISCGTGSIQGAICNVDILEGKPHLKTIGDKSPVGICGTGVIETVSEFLKEEIIDETGLLDDEYVDSGYLLASSDDGREIRFTQKDVREIQLAKSAIRAGIETIILRYGISYDDIDSVYLAGGFGYRVDTEKAAAIGLLPGKLLPKIIPAGNTSLKGALEYLMTDHGADRLAYMISRSEETGLSTDKSFNELYIQHMLFGNDCIR